MKIIIDRNTWLRGEGYFNSFLLRSYDQKKCCVGFYASTLGISEHDLHNTRTLQSVTNIESLCNWVHTDDMEKLYITNDSQYLSEEVREKQITEIFNKYGVEVEFIN